MTKLYCKVWGFLFGKCELQKKNARISLLIFCNKIFLKYEMFNIIEIGKCTYDNIWVKRYLCSVSSETFSW